MHLRSNPPFEHKTLTYSNTNYKNRLHHVKEIKFVYKSTPLIFYNFSSIDLNFGKSDRSSDVLATQLL